jgi:23S rRNA pseudoU1915 N3-methylase RlmH
LKFLEFHFLLYSDLRLKNFLGFEQISEMIIQREVSHSNDNYPNDEVARLLQEIEKMKQVSRVNDERTRLMSEEMSKKINQLNVQVESVKNSDILFLIFFTKY